MKIYSLYGVQNLRKRWNFVVLKYLRKRLRTNRIVLVRLTQKKYCKFSEDFHSIYVLQHNKKRNSPKIKKVGGLIYAGRNNITTASICLRFHLIWDENQFA